MKKFIILILIILLPLIILQYAKHTIAKIILIKGAKHLTGLEVDMKDIKVGLLKTWIDIKDFNIFNPTGFQDTLLADIPSIYIDYDIGAFFKNEIHIEKFQIFLKELIVIRDADGKFNINFISGISKSNVIDVQTGKQSKLKIKIDELEIKIDNVLYKDYAQIPVAVFEYPVNINERCENITDFQSLIKLIIAKGLINTTISRLSNLDLTIFKEGISNLLQKNDILKPADESHEAKEAIDDARNTLYKIFRRPMKN